MRLGILFAVLLTVCATTTACTTGLYGAAAGGSPPAPKGTPTTATTTQVHQFGGPTNLLPNGSFDATPSPWLSSGAAGDLGLTGLHRMGYTALLVRPKTPAAFATKAVIAKAPARGARYSFDGWVHGSPDLAGAPVMAELVAVQITGPNGAGKWLTMGSKVLPLGHHWRHFSVRGKVPIAGAYNVTAVVEVVGSVSKPVSKHSWFALDGVAAKLVTPVAKATRPVHGRS